MGSPAHSAGRGRKDDFVYTEIISGGEIQDKIAIV